MEAPLFKTSPDTHPVAWVQSEGSQQKKEEAGPEGSQPKWQLSPCIVCVLCGITFVPLHTLVYPCVIALYRPVIRRGVCSVLLHSVFYSI